MHWPQSAPAPMSQDIKNLHCKPFGRPITPKFSKSSLAFASGFLDPAERVVLAGQGLRTFPGQLLVVISFQGCRSMLSRVGGQSSQRSRNWQANW